MKLFKSKKPAVVEIPPRRFKIGQFVYKENYEYRIDNCWPELVSFSRMIVMGYEDNDKNRALVCFVDCNNIIIQGLRIQSIADTDLLTQAEADSILNTQRSVAEAAEMHINLTERICKIEVNPCELR